MEAQNEKPPGIGGEFSDPDEEEEEEIPQEEKDKALLEACRESKIDEVIAQLEKEANPLYEKDGWNPLLWASCNGNEEIVRILLARNAHHPYLDKQA